MKFRKYSEGQKSVDNFINKIGETYGKDVVIGYGNWSRDTQMKHFMPTMNKGLRKLIHRKYQTITVNEAYTSKKCCECHGDLEHHKNSEGKDIFRLLVCPNCVRHVVKHTVFRTRDGNSAQNIKTLVNTWLEKRERPEAFKRPLSDSHPLGTK